MDSQVLAHLERIEHLVQALARLPWLGAEELESIRATLLDFDAGHWAIVRILSLPLYRELTALLESGEAARLLPERPRLAVVMPVYGAQRDLLHQALSSLRRQVGVGIECWISIDGRHEDRDLVEAVIASLDATSPSAPWQVSLLYSDRNRGVGLCRNRALQEITAPYFTCLDADDVFHPLRCLHGLLLLLREGLMRLNTGWCRASLVEKKIVLINDRTAHVGHNSFLARTELIGQCGYQANLRFFEDTEFMLRHCFYGIVMLNSAVVSHYLHTEPRDDYVSLASPCRLEVHAIRNHPYLCGSVVCKQPQSWRAIELKYQERYQTTPREALPQLFPPFPVQPASSPLAKS